MSSLENFYMSVVDHTLLQGSRVQRSENAAAQFTLKLLVGETEILEVAKGETAYLAMHHTFAKALDIDCKHVPTDYPADESYKKMLATVFGRFTEALMFGYGPSRPIPPVPQGAKILATAEAT